MAQRLWIELDRLNHLVHVKIVLNIEDIIDAVLNLNPDLIIAPFLKTKIPKNVWNQYTCLVVHPGIKGDRGASSLDWAILEEKKEWGVTILQAVEKMDAGPIWATVKFPLRKRSKASIYRHEVTQAAVKGIMQSLESFKNSTFQPETLDYSKADVEGKWRRSTETMDYQFEWNNDANSVIRKINAADSSPGALVRINHKDYYAYGGHHEDQLKGKPGQILAQRNRAICLGVGNLESIWISHLKRVVPGSIKLPATTALHEELMEIPVNILDSFANSHFRTFREIKYTEKGQVGYVSFDFYNGAMDKDQCHRLREVIIRAKERPIRVIVLLGGSDLWSNGIHLNIIEYAESPAEEAWINIHAIDDLIREIIESTDHYIICALQGNAGAGGVSFALSGDKVLAREGIVLNPHTKNMGLYGSEYWTYLLPKRIGTQKALQFTEECLPWGTTMAKEIGLIDDVFGETAELFREKVRKTAENIAALPYFDKLILAKKLQRKKDERVKPLQRYREEELERMRKNFFEDDQGFSMKRHHFVHKIKSRYLKESAKDRDLYSSRRMIYRKRKWESIEYKPQS